MKFAGFKTICRVLIASLLMLQFQFVHAGMVGADQVIAASSVQVDRATVTQALGRAEVASQLQSMGVDPAQARDRVAAMTDDEVRTVAGNLETLPAGAMFDGGWWVIAAVVALVVYFSWKRSP